MDLGQRYELVRVAGGGWGSARLSEDRLPEPAEPTIAPSRPADTRHRLGKLWRSQAVPGERHWGAGGSEVHRAGRKGKGESLRDWGSWQRFVAVAPQPGPCGGGLQQRRRLPPTGCTPAACDAQRPPAPLSLQIDKNVEREIINHRMLSGHPNIVCFREVRRQGRSAGARTPACCNTRAFSPAAWLC